LAADGVVADRFGSMVGECEVAVGAVHHGYERAYGCRSLWANREGLRLQSFRKVWDLVSFMVAAVCRLPNFLSPSTCCRRSPRGEGPTYATWGNRRHESANFQKITRQPLWLSPIHASRVILESQEGGALSQPIGRSDGL
jgi:hypothetical protein